MSRASCPWACRVATRVLSCMQLPQNMPAAPAVMYAILTVPRLAPERLIVGFARRFLESFIAAEGGRLFFRFLVGRGQAKGCDQRDQVCGAANDGRRGRHLHGRGTAKHLRQNLGIEGGGHRADHAATDVRGEAPARAAEVHWVDAWQKFTEETELRHR